MLNENSMVQTFNFRVAYVEDGIICKSQVPVGGLCHIPRLIISTNRAEHLLSDEVAQCEDGVVSGVRKVSQQVVDGSRVRVVRLHHGAQHRQHRQPPVLDLPRPQILQLRSVRVRAPSQGVEPQPSGITHIGSRQLVVWEYGVHVHGSRLDDVCPSSALRPCEQDQLDHKQGDGVCEVLCVTGHGPRRGVQDACLGQSLRDEDARSTEHGPSAVHKFGLDEPLEQSRVGSCKFHPRMTTSTFRQTMQHAFE